MMKISKNIPLKKYNTFGLDYKAECMIRLKNEKEATALFNGTVPWQKPLLILGSGSNLLFTGDFKGTILYPELNGIKIEKAMHENGHVIVSAGALAATTACRLESVRWRVISKLSTSYARCSPTFAAGCSSQPCPDTYGTMNGYQSTRLVW